MRSVSVLLPGIYAAVALPLFGQLPDSLPNSQLGAVFDVGFPQGAFGQVVGTRVGADLFYAIAFDRARHFRFRIDGSFMTYGKKRMAIPLSPYLPADQGNIETSNGIYSLTLGPQVTLTTGAVRPYVTTQAGFSCFATETSVTFEVADSTIQLYRHTDFGDSVFAWRTGLGVQFQLSGGRFPVALDVGGRWSHTGPVRYLTKGIVQRGPGGSVSIAPVESDTSILGMYFGVVIGY